MRKYLLSGLLLVLALLPTSLIFGQGSITIDYLGGQIGPDTVCADRPLIFGLRMTNATGGPIPGFSTGFKIYSPDGATWGGTSGHFTGEIEDFMNFQAGVTTFSCDGAGADTVGFAGLALTGGLPASYDQIGLVIVVEKAQLWDGRSICIDSAWFPPAAHWTWSVTTPTWGGPYCFDLHLLPCLDTDNDGVLCGCDNCEDIYNPGQTDADFDFIGDACQCCAMRGDVNHSGGLPDIADITYMVAHMFKSGPEPPCLVESDINADNSHDIADLTALANFMFKSGATPAGCP